MIDIEALISDYCSHAKTDYVGLWQIASRVKDELGSDSAMDIRKITLAVVRGLMSRGVYPGDYTREGFLFWRGETEDIMNRIDGEMTNIGGIPNLAAPICWFALRPK